MNHVITKHDDNDYNNYTLLSFAVEPYTSFLRKYASELLITELYYYINVHYRYYL